jgi:hypothetical protein
MMTAEPAPPALPNVSGVRIAGFTIPAPAALAMAFADKATITGPELCRLLPMDPETLRRHIRAGHIAYLRIGFGDRRAFTLDSIMRFLEGRSVTEQPPERKQRRRASSATGEAGSGFRAQLERRTAELRQQRTTRR